MSEALSLCVCKIWGILFSLYSSRQRNDDDWHTYIRQSAVYVRPDNTNNIWQEISDYTLQCTVIINFSLRTGKSNQLSLLTIYVRERVCKCLIFLQKSKPTFLNIYVCVCVKWYQSAEWQIIYSLKDVFFCVGLMILLIIFVSCLSCVTLNLTVIEKFREVQQLFWCYTTQHSCILEWLFVVRVLSLGWHPFFCFNG